MKLLYYGGAYSMMNNQIKDLAAKFIDQIDKKYKIKFAYLFGSFARAEETDQSDVDLAVFFEKNYDELQELLIRGDMIEEGTAFFSKKVDIVSLSKTSTLLKYEIIRCGILLKDHEDRADFESLGLREYFDFQYYSDIYNKTVIERIKGSNYFGGDAKDGKQRSRLIKSR
jgi:uncharacterized protein